LKLLTAPSPAAGMIHKIKSNKPQFTTIIPMQKCTVLGKQNVLSNHNCMKLGCNQTTPKEWSLHTAIIIGIRI